MPIDYEVTVLRYDAKGRLNWRSTLSVDEALLAVLRFARKNRNSTCTIELRESAGPETIKLDKDDPA